MKSKRKVRNECLIQVFCVLLGLIVLFPILYALSVSFMENRDILSRTPRFLPRKITLDNYRTALFSTLLPRYILNSFVVATVCGVSRIIFGSMAAYAFAFYEFKGKSCLLYTSPRPRPTGRPPSPAWGRSARSPGRFTGGAAR